MPDEPTWRNRRTWRHRPPWWPEGEDWPRRRGRPPVFAFVAIAISGLIGLGLMMALVFHRPWFLGPLGLLTILFFARFGRPRYYPVGKLVDAASRLAAGDYSARVPALEAGPMRQVVTSFNGMAERLEQSSEQRRRLMADLGHELRTPLTVIQGELEAMADGVHPLSRQQVEMLLDETRLLARLVDDLRVLSLTEAGELRLDRELIEANTIVTDAVAPYLASAARSGIAIEAEADPGSLSVDPLRIKEILANLITNAVRHTPEGGTVLVWATRRATDWMFSVSDTGFGISPEHLPKIFERFYKGSDSRGTGLGLSIARELVRAHGGDIKATSVEGQGTTIEFTVPLPKGQ